MARQLEASNLGQMIGRLLYAAEAELVTSPSIPHTDESKRAPNGRRQTQVLSLAEAHGEVTNELLCRVLGFTTGYASVLLWEMTKRGQLVKVNDKRPFSLQGRAVTIKPRDLVRTPTGETGHCVDILPRGEREVQLLSGVYLTIRADVLFLVRAAPPMPWPAHLPPKGRR